MRERLEDWIGADNPVRVIDVFVDHLDLGGLGFGRVAPRATGRPGYHPSVSLKLYIFGTEMAVHVLAYNRKRIMNILGVMGIRLDHAGVNGKNLRR